MQIRIATKYTAACALLAGVAGAFAQHAGSSGQHHHAVEPAGPAASPYAGQQAREIKSLSTNQTQDLLAGKGMELAKAAELNGYPGPMHTLELATQLGLTAAQKSATEALLASHKAQARLLGARIVEAERLLDEAFASRQIDAARTARLTERIGILQGTLRAEHLQTHLAQTALLDARQITTYKKLRGYL